MATFEERNPYVTATPKVKKKKPVKYTGLLNSQDQKDETGLLGESTTPQNETSYNQGLLIGNSQQDTQDLNALRQAYINNYMQKWQAQQDDAQQKNMETGLAKSGVKYAANSAASSAAANQYSNIGPKQGSNVGSSDAATSYKVDMSGQDTANPEGVTQGEAVPEGESSSGSSGSVLGAATGALAGYGAGTKNYYTDPAMQDHKDGFGKYHKDHRAEVGGGILGGVVGYYGDGYGNAAIPSLVEWIHPYAQDGTRWMINAGDSLGGAYGAMAVDPIGTWASGKYSNADLTASSLTPLLAPIAGGKAPDVAQKFSDPISKVGNKIADIFGW